uniref:Uncharacterized protein n=1 Tax=Romanomermis culicivorax TaxID=13658 RepID=A0A915HGD6_ROMCU
MDCSLLFFCYIFCDFVLLVTGNAELFSQIVNAPSRLSSSPSRLPKKPKDLRVREFDFVEKFLKFGADVRQCFFYSSPYHCQSYDDGTLIRRLKDEGDYNPTYMAPTVEEAARRFEDLSLKPFELVTGYCSRTDAIERLFMQGCLKRETYLW